MHESISNIEVLWAIAALETPTVSALTESLPVSKATVRRRLSTLQEAGHVDTYVTSLPQFPSAYELTDSGDAELAPAIATADETIYTIGDTRVYPLPPVDGVDGEAGPDSEVAQYFNGRPDALSDDVILGALARAVYQLTPPAARPGTDDATPAAGTADSGDDGDGDSGADAASEGELDGDSEAATDPNPEPDTDVEADAEPVMGADVDTPRPLAGVTATWHGDAYWGPPTPAHGEVAWWWDRTAPEPDRQPPPAAPPEPHTPAADAEPAVIGLPVPPETLRTDVWVTTTAIAAHAPCLRSTLKHYLRRLGNTGLVVARIPNRKRGAPDEAATGGDADATDAAATDREAGSTAASGSAADPNNLYVPGWWRLTPAGCARLAALVDDGVAAVADP